MTPRNFPEYAELWQEQIEPDELAELQAMAGSIQRTARRKWLIDTWTGLAMIALVSVILSIYTTPPLTKIVIALILGALIWAGWKRHVITKASRALAVREPRVFFETVIKNVREEIRYSTTSLILGVIILIFGTLLFNYARGESPDYLLRWVFEIHPYRAAFSAVAFIICYGYFIRDNIKLREQLRRFERMSREWDE